MNTGNSSQNVVNESPQSFDTRPLWKYVTKMAKSTEGGGGNIPFKCNICKMTFKGSYSRVKSHLLKIGGSGIRPCPKVNNSQFMEMMSLEEEATEKRDRNQPNLIPLTPVLFNSSQSSSSSSMSVDALGSMRQEGYAPKKRKTSGDTPLERAFNSQTRELLDSEIARMFYSGGIPFNLARNPHYVRAFSFAANNKIGGYTPPSYNALRTTLMEKERSTIESNLESIKSTWKNNGVSLVCDGWTDPQRRHLINFMAVSEVGTMFIRAANCEGEYKDKFFISRLIKEVIVEVGVNNVVQIITDNAPVCKAAGLLEISKMAKLCLRRLISNEDDRRVIRMELGNFLGCFEDFGDGDSLRDRLTMNPMQWWIIHGPAAPNLQKIALRLLSHVSSSSCSERNWSTYSFIHSTKRNNITPQRAQDLVFIHSNLRLTSRKTPQYLKGETKMWDVAGDAFESSDDVGILEIANLTLDEPELKRDLVADEVGEGLQDAANLDN